MDLKGKWPGLKYVKVLGKQNIFAVLQDRLFFFSLFVRRATWVMVSDLYVIQQRREVEKVTATEWHKLRVLDNE